MRLTTAQRQSAVAVAELVEAGGMPDRDGVLLLAQTVLDGHDTFRRIYPVYAAVSKVLAPGGPAPGSWKALETAWRASQENQ